MLLQILGFIIGLLYLWWEYQADKKVWIASVIMPAISMWIYYSKGLYADFAINIYYLIIAVYGFLTWSNKSAKKNKKPLTISHVSLPTCGMLTVVCIALWYVIWLVLYQFTDSTVPIADAFTTALSIVGLWMMARKYAEQWIVWIIVDTVCCALYFYKNIPFYGVLYAIYTVIAFFGYKKWIRIMQDQLDSKESCDNPKH